MQRSVSPQSQELGPTAWVGGTNNADMVKKKAHERIFERFKAPGQPEPAEQLGSKGLGLSYLAAVRIDWPSRIFAQSKP